MADLPVDPYVEDTEPRAQERNPEKACGFAPVSNVLARGLVRVSDGALCTYLTLKSFAGLSPDVFAGQKTIAEARGITERAVRKHLQELEDAGLITSKRRGQGRTAILYLEDMPTKACREYLKRWRSGVPSVPVKTGTSVPVKTGTRKPVLLERQEEPTKKNNNKAVVASADADRATARMVAIGVRPPQQRKLLAKYEPEILNRRLDYIEANPEKVNNPAGFLVSALENDYHLPGAEEKADEGEDMERLLRGAAVSVARKYLAEGEGDQTKAAADTERDYPGLGAWAVEEALRRG